MSKNIIFYFTGTGNSLKAAKDIAKVVGDCEIVLVTNFRKRKLIKKYESVGFIYPVYASGLPNYFYKFLNLVDFTESKDAYFYSVATYGGTSGNSAAIVDKALKKQGIVLNAFYGVRMFPNYVALYNMGSDPIKINDCAVDKIKEIAEKIASKTNTPVNTKFNNLHKLFYKIFKSKFANMDKNYNVSDDCTRCQLCVKVCPVRNIQMIDGKLKFKHRCEQCMACIQTCPNKALNYKNKTQNRGRYINPSIKIKDLFVGN